MANRLGCQFPTNSVVLPYQTTNGQEAIDLYNSTGREAMEWQTRLLFDILALNEDGLYVHSKFGYSVPRRNGKNEIVSIRELYGLFHNERCLHTAHRTTTSSSASKRLATLLEDLGYEEVLRPKKGEKYDKHYTYSKQFGLEKIAVLGENGGICEFRTRTSSGGLGEGFDLLVIDEAQEYTEDQESSLKYTVSDSANPQILFCGTPPTKVSKGTVFLKLRNACLEGNTIDTGWAEWSVSAQSDPNDIELWYLTNPSMGKILTERKVRAEIGNDDLDFNIQRLGYWVRFNQSSAITQTDWESLQTDTMPKVEGQLTVGIKYGKDGKNVSMAIAVKTTDDKVFIECIDCRPIKNGNAWLIGFLKQADVQSIIIDGANGQSILTAEIKDAEIIKPHLPTVKEVIEAFALFEQGIYKGNIVHMEQPSLTNAITNCEKRTIGSNGGFGYKTFKEGAETSLIDAVVLAYWGASKIRKKQKQKMFY